MKASTTTMAINADTSRTSRSGDCSGLGSVMSSTPFSRSTLGPGRPSPPRAKVPGSEGRPVLRRSPSGGQHGRARHRQLQRRPGRDRPLLLDPTEAEASPRQPARHRRHARPGNATRLRGQDLPRRRHHPPRRGRAPAPVASRRPAMQLQSCRLVAPTGSASCRFTEVVEGRLLGLLWPLGPLVAWLLQRQTAADLRRLNQLLEAPATSGPTQEDGDRASQ